MGFPKREAGRTTFCAWCECAEAPTVPTRLSLSLSWLCSHIDLRTEGYVCPRCQSFCCELPTECLVCGLSLVLSPHLARSYHHLFPVLPFAEVKPSTYGSLSLSLCLSVCVCLYVQTRPIASYLKLQLLL